MASCQLYLGGEFTSVDRQRRARLARVDAATGALDAGWAPAAENSVLAMQVFGGALFVGGGKFLDVTDAAGAHPATHVAKVSAATGAVDLGFAARPNDVVRSLALASDGSQLYLGGDFSSVSGVARAVQLTGVDPVPGVVSGSFRPDAYNGTAKPSIYAKSVDGSRLLIGAGGSGGFGGQTRYKLALGDEPSGAILTAAPRVNSALGVFALASAARQVYAGGGFTKIGSVAQPHLATIVTAAGVTAPGVPPNVVHVRATATHT